MTKLSRSATWDCYTAIHGDILALLQAARRAAALSVDAVRTATYWVVGTRGIGRSEVGGSE
jgi:hypothetical protein